MVSDVRSIVVGEKAAHFSFSDQAGGYLVTPEVHDGIMRIAQISGLVPRDARKFGMSSDELERDRSLANPAYRPPPDPCVMPKAMLVIEHAKGVSQPDS